MLPDRGPHAPAVTAEVVIRLGRRAHSTGHQAGRTLLETARAAGLSPPSSCEAGNCATCLARLVEGTAVMRVNDALTPEEVADGWILTCQAVPTSPTVTVDYGD
jgi:ferredoxin